ncbi:hypothetical protein EKM02_11285 [Flavobacterium sp. RSP49]|uniref:DUF5672 family protein n=1 Tax=unclassified Flavobacterium TaxID=196869 RepID=UPI000F82B1A4|nr:MULTISPECIES: DUF5672 family protein [unclassified Flavobacterium]RTY87754.1 hypothetical protein EKM00_05565 [Flavobacterium sp. RSP15]RTY98750.1 hypothetical protein EKM02_11285 [Flavobacterium sp. RSP49]
MKNSVKVVIPIYKSYFGELEEKSFLRCLKVLVKYEIILVQPEGLDNSYITAKYDAISVENFPKKYFQNIEGYNELLLSSSFYERFLDSEYILIYQLDAFVFKDELAFWCNQGYDYIGAPWIASLKKSIWAKFFNLIARKFRSKKKNDREQTFFKVGNGGFSLRKTASHYAVVKQNEPFILDFLRAEEKEIYAIEDVFWSLKAAEFNPDFRIPDYIEALRFAIDRKPKIALMLNNNELPFGCHGINKPKVMEFWEPILNQH